MTQARFAGAGLMRRGRTPEGLPALNPLPNALGLWHIDTYAASPRGSIVNANGAVAASANLIGAPRNLFNNGDWWIKGAGCTVTDNFAAAADGTTSASRVVGTASNWTLHPANPGVNMPAATYTIRVQAMRNGGSDQVFCLYSGNTGNRSPVKTATASWQPFSFTFTLGAPANPGLIGIGSSNGSTAADILICDLRVYSGSSDLGAGSYAGNLELGIDAWDTTPSYASGALDMSAGGVGLAQFGTDTTLSTFTCQALVSKINAGGSGGNFGLLSKAQAFTTFSMMTEKATVPFTYFQSAVNVAAPIQQAGLWVAGSKGYHVVTVRYDGTTFTYWIDDVQILTSTVSLSSVTVADLYMNFVSTVTLYGGNKFAGSLALWSRSLSDAEVRAAVTLQQSRAALSSITATSATRVLVAEGDSITAQAICYPWLFGPNASPALYGVDYAVSGSAIADLVTRAPLVDAALPTNRSGRKFILSVLIGANDLVSLGTSTWLTNLASYLDARRGAGWLVALITPTPQTAGVGPGFNAARATILPTIRAWTGVHCDAIADFAAEATMGPDAAASNATYYSDGKHPTATGQALLEIVYRATINAM